MLRIALVLDQEYPHPVVFHWYSGTLKNLDAAIERGLFFSINPAMLAIAFLWDTACEFLHCCKNFVSIADRDLGRRIGIQKDHDV